MGVWAHSISIRFMAPVKVGGEIIKEEREGVRHNRAHNSGPVFTRPYSPGLSLMI